MISEVHTHEDPILTREEAIEILNTPDDQLDALIERAGILRKMSAVVTALRTALTVRNPVALMQTSTLING